MNWDKFLTALEVATSESYSIPFRQFARNEVIVYVRSLVENEERHLKTLRERGLPI